jgi:chromosome partitioning protein
VEFAKVLKASKEGLGEQGIPAARSDLGLWNSLANCHWLRQVDSAQSGMARIICIANQKGGVGKTTTAVNLSVGLARAGERTLLIDLDPQCNATSGVGLKPAASHPLLLDTPLKQSLQATAWENLELLPGSRRFVDVDRLENGDESSSAILRQHLDAGMASFDYVLIDCPPSLGQLTQAALSASTEVLMPIQCEFYAMEGLTQMIHVIRDVMQRGEGRLTFGGILLTMYDPSLELTQEVDTEVREFFGDIVFDTVIPRDVAVSEAPSHGQSVMDYAPRSRGCRAYLELCMEVLERD